MFNILLTLVQLFLITTGFNNVIIEVSYDLYQSHVRLSIPKIKLSDIIWSTLATNHFILVNNFSINDNPYQGQEQWSPVYQGHNQLIRGGGMIILILFNSPNVLPKMCQKVHVHVPCMIVQSIICIDGSVTDLNGLCTYDHEQLCNNLAKVRDKCSYRRKPLLFFYKKSSSVLLLHTKVKKNKHEISILLSFLLFTSLHHA